MLTTLHPAVLLGSRRPALSPAQALATRIRMVLETRPGDLPFRPDFGCDLSSFAGQPATDRRIEAVKLQVEAALVTQIPGIKVRRIEVKAVTDVGTAPGRLREVPLAEAALVRLGVQATLDVRLDVSSPAGEVSVSANLSP
ncbi:MAG: GPW/gp25 family protein [Alphaproteobacteria bacterium]|nr:GPW/gp25 family protein [Alphaproteobacteria bacterium]